MPLVRAPPAALRRRVLSATARGQTRYEELRDSLDVDTHALDRTLMQLAPDGKVSLIVVGDSLNVRGHVDPDG